MLFTGTEVTAYLPYYGPVTWPSDRLDTQATEWLNEHVPVGPDWRLPFFRPNDARGCATCPHARWEQCQYALWARYYLAQRHC